MRSRVTHCKTGERTLKSQVDLLLTSLCFPCFKSLDKCPDGWKGFQDSCYYVPDGGMRVSLSEAEEICKRVDAQVLVINSAEENRFVANLMRDQDYRVVWLGMRKSSGYLGTWKQLNGEEVTFNMLREITSSNIGHRPFNRYGSSFDMRDMCVVIYGSRWLLVGCSDRGAAVAMCKRRMVI